MRVFPLWKCFQLTLLLATKLHAQTIFWYSPAKKTNFASTGQAMDGTFQFELGAFSGGFVPTVGNINQWSSHWVSADSVSYGAGPAALCYDKDFTITSNAAPFTVGAAAYVWGRSGGATKDEWILFRKSDWTWPNVNSSPPAIFDWNAATANQVILGSINSSGAPYLMKSAAISSYSQWVAAEMPDESASAAFQDPDEDGVSNLMEYVFGTSPRVPNAATPTPISLIDIGGEKFLQISIPRRVDHLASLVIEVSGDLSQWNSGPAQTMTVEDSATALIVRDLTAINPGNPRRFMRLKATLP